MKRWEGYVKSALRIQIDIFAWIMVVIYWRMNTWCMVTVSEYGTLCLDYGPGAWSVSINRNEGEEGTRNHVFATAMTDRGGRQRPLVGNEAFRHPNHPSSRDKSPFRNVYLASTFHSVLFTHLLSLIKFPRFNISFKIHIDLYEICSLVHKLVFRDERFIDYIFQAIFIFRFEYRCVLRELVSRVFHYWAA